MTHWMPFYLVKQLIINEWERQKMLPKDHTRSTSNSTTTIYSAIDTFTRTQWWRAAINLRKEVRVMVSLAEVLGHPSGVTITII